MRRREFLKATGIGALAVGSAPEALAADAPSPAAEELRIRVGPYLQNPAPGAMTVMWMTSAPCVAWVEYGPTGQLGHKAHPDVDGLRQANTAIHRVRLTGLKPGERCHYRIVCQPITTYQPYKIIYGPQIASPVYTFTTPVAGAERVRFVVFNDLHDNVKLWRELNALVAQEPVDFVFLNGDVTDYLQDERQMVDHFLAVCTEMFATRTPFLYARGNHETRGAWSRRMKDYLDLPGDRYHYDFTWGPTSFVVLDSGEDKPDAAPVYAGLCDFDAYRDAQCDWLAHALRSDPFTSARWRIAIHHIPALYNTQGDEIPESHAAVHVRRTWWPLLESAKVDLYLGGHTHVPTIKPADPAMGHSFPVVIGGGPRKGIGTVMLVDADREHLHVKMWRDDGTVFGEVAV
jgi:predicted MPP superfamily phosphohydrolase